MGPAALSSAISERASEIGARSLSCLSNEVRRRRNNRLKVRMVQGCECHPRAEVATRLDGAVVDYLTGTAEVIIPKGGCFLVPSIKTRANILAV